MGASKPQKVTTPRKTTQKSRTSKRSTSTTSSKKNTEKISELESKLDKLIMLLYSDMSTEMLQGPSGLAKKIKSSGLLE